MTPFSSLLSQWPHFLAYKPNDPPFLSDPFWMTPFFQLGVFWMTPCFDKLHFIWKTPTLKIVEAHPRHFEYGVPPPGMGLHF